MKTCISCGMPMEKAADFAIGDESKDYCFYCARPDGSMKSYEEQLESMVGFIVKTQGLDPEQAREATKAAMANLPAWKNKTVSSEIEKP